MRALFERAPRLTDLVPFVGLADGLPTPVEVIQDDFLVQRDDLTSVRYGGNKVRKLEFTLPIAVRRGGPVLTAGATGSHHVLATVVHAAALGVEVEAVRYPQVASADADANSARFDKLMASGSAVERRTASPYTMPVELARGLFGLLPRYPTFVWPGASTPLGCLGHVSAGLELVGQFEIAGHEPPDEVVVAFGSGSTAVGLALGIALGGWRHTAVRAVRITDWIVTNRGVARMLEAGTRAYLQLAGVRPPPMALVIDGRWVGAGYAHPTAEGAAATEAAAGWGLELESTYTAKAFAAALHQRDRGRRVLFVQTYAAGGAA